MLSNVLITGACARWQISIIGGGYIALEFAGIFKRFGAETHVVYRQKKPLRGFDEEVRCQTTSYAALAHCWLAARDQASSRPLCQQHDMHVQRVVNVTQSLVPAGRVLIQHGRSTHVGILHAGARVC